MEYLNDQGLLIEQPENLYKLSSDAVALGNFVQCKKTDVVFDIGCGTGVLTLLVAFNHRPHKIVSIDINTEAAKQLEKNLAINKNKLTTTKFTVLHGDARQLHKMLDNQAADVIMCNPPYFNTGKKPQNAHKLLARHDDTLPLEDLAKLCTKI